MQLLLLAFTVHLFLQEVIFISKTNFPPQVLTLNNKHRL